MTRHYMEADLPSWPEMPPIIQLHLEQLEEFRAAFYELRMFAATICNRPVDSLTAGDVVANLPKPQAMTEEQLRYWSKHPAYASWQMLLEMNEEIRS